MNLLKPISIVLTVLLLNACATTEVIDPVEAATRAKLTTLANSSSRPAASVARNQYRNPVETLMFFGLRDDMTVDEVSPVSGAWYTEILAPMMRDSGTLYTAGYDPQTDNQYIQSNAIKFNEKMIANPEMFDQIKETVFALPEKVDIAPANSADLVVVFRSFHGWAGGDNQQAAMEAIYKALKPGGVLGLVQHRMNEETVIPAGQGLGDVGYIKTSVVVETAKSAGFELAESSEINANLLDTKNHPNGVWTLPPANRYDDLPAGTDTSAFKAIGESDRMTLKFVKPE